MASQAQLVRDWAKQNGYAVGIRGRIAPAIWSAYAEAHDGFEREAPQSGTAICAPGCGRRWTGLRECHCRRCHAHFSSVYTFDAHIVDRKCVEPLKAATPKGELKLREKDTVWGPIYVSAKENDAWTQTDLLD